ncbi:MAG: histidinol-phosphatase HisJ [Cellulosilyticaceae bacterium]
MEREKIVRDGHIHTPFCPHGTGDALHQYVERGLEIGLEVMSFTEHMPLPDGVLTPEVAAYCSPSSGVILDYFKAVEVIKKQYEDKMVIATGLEVDYIEGCEGETRKMLEVYGPYLQDSLLSVHIMDVKGKYICFDEIKGFEEALERMGSVEAIYDLYYETLLKAIRADLGPYKPRRLGHLSLVRVFKNEYPLEYKNEALLEEVVRAIKESKMAVEFNTGGLRKPTCEELYPSGRLRELVEQYDIPILWGSDSHRAQDIGFGFGEY